MSKIIFVFVFLVVFAFSQAHDWCESSKFREFKNQNKKTYKDSNEEHHRCKIFTENHRKITHHNGLYEAGNVSYSLAVNMFADISSEEFVKTYTGLLPPPENYRVKRSGSTSIKVPSNFVAGQVDLRTSAIPVKDQGACGSCWAFAATSVAEYNRLKAIGKYTKFSEQECVDCARPQGCNGGWMSECFDLHLKEGINFDSVYPYVAKVGTCSVSVNTSTGITTNRQWRSIPGDENLMAYLLQKYGWITASLNADMLQFYKTGIIQAASCSKVPNHAVTLVGYGTDPATNKKYWLLRNSWGTSWGEGGYFKMERGVNTCGIANSYEGYRIYLE